MRRPALIVLIGLLITAVLLGVGTRLAHAQQANFPKVKEY